MTAPDAELPGHVRDWMFNAALPLWAQAGVDRVDGGFVEQLDFQGRDAGAPGKRTRVTCRQIYVFSHAALLGQASGIDLARHGLAFLDRAWDADRGYWARLQDRRGAVIDATPDLYDLAFGLFALGWWMRASGEADRLDQALLAVDFIEREMRGPITAFKHALPAEGPRQQNPHMHLLEASLILSEATGHPRFALLADELVDAFKTHFFDGRNLAEFFAEDWSRTATPEGRIVEPGHMFEWAWILAQHQRLSGDDHTATIRPLVEFAETFGVDPATQVTAQQILDDGSPLDSGSRSWPNTERIKAWVAMGEIFGAPEASARMCGSARLLLDRYLATPTPGLWSDHFDAQGRAISTNVPASTLYHVFLAFAELLRFSEARPR